MLIPQGGAAEIEELRNIVLKLSAQIVDKDTYIRQMEVDHKNEVQDLNYEIADLRAELRAAHDELFDNRGY